MPIKFSISFLFLSNFILISFPFPSRLFFIFINSSSLNFPHIHLFLHNSKVSFIHLIHNPHMFSYHFSLSTRTLLLKTENQPLTTFPSSFYLCLLRQNINLRLLQSSPVPFIWFRMPTTALVQSST